MGCHVFFPSWGYSLRSHLDSFEPQFRWASVPFTAKATESQGLLHSSIALPHCMHHCLTVADFSGPRAYSCSLHCIYSKPPAPAYRHSCVFHVVSPHATILAHPHSSFSQCKKNFIQVLIGCKVDEERLHYYRVRTGNYIDYTVQHGHRCDGWGTADRVA